MRPWALPPLATPSLTAARVRVRVLVRPEATPLPVASQLKIYWNHEALIPVGSRAQFPLVPPPSQRVSGPQPSLKVVLHSPSVSPGVLLLYHHLSQV